MIATDHVLRGFASTAVDVHDDLTTLDQQSGDGDFGDNLCSGLAASLSRLDEVSADGGNRRDALSIAGQVFLDTVGGTSGPLFGLLFQAVGRALEEASDPNLSALAQGVTEGLAAIQRVGEAEVGDRTMVDALTPAAAALCDGAPLEVVAEAAYAGAVNTRHLRARHGRASYVGERALGAPDPGAVGIALLFRAFAESDHLSAPLTWTVADLLRP